jgi:hypothetical protein
MDVETYEQGEGAYWELWEKRYAPAYQEMSDRFLIVTHVCELLWDSHPDCRHDDPWDDKYDGRGAQFREEFVREIRKLAAAIIPDIKKTRQLKGDL